MPSISQSRGQFSTAKNVNGDNNENSAAQLSCTGQEVKDCCHGDEWIEKHSGSSAFVRERLKKFQSNNLAGGKVTQKIRPKSAFLQPSSDHKTFDHKNSGSQQNKTRSDSEKACYKMTSSPTSHVDVKDEAAEASATRTANDVFGNDRSATLVRRSLPHEIECSKSVECPSPDLTEMSVSKLSSIFETSASFKKPLAKTNQVGIKTNANINNGCIDYLSVLRPCETSEWNRGLLPGKSSSKSVSCLIQSGDKNDLIDTQSLIHRVRHMSLHEDEEPNKSTSHDSASKQNDFRASASTLSSSTSSVSSLRSSPLLPRSQRQDNNLPDAKCLHVRARTLPGLKSILKRDHRQQQQHQLLGQVAGSKEITFGSPNDEVSGEVPFFRRVLKRSVHSDIILYEGRPTLDSKTMSTDPDECTSVDNQQAVQRRLSQHNINSWANRTGLPKCEDHSSYKSSKTDFSNDCVDYLSVLKKTRKDSSSNHVDANNASNEADANSQELPFYKLKLRKTDHSALLLEADNSNSDGNDIKGDGREDAPPESAPPRETTTTTFKSKAYIGSIGSTSSLSSSSPLSKSQPEWLIGSETISNSQESLQSSDSERCLTDSETRVVLRKMSTDSQLGAPKRRAIIRLSVDCSLPPRFIDAYENDSANALLGGTSDDEEPSKGAVPWPKDNKKTQSKLEMTLKELRQSEVNYIDKLELIEYFKSELMRMRAITEQEASVMFVNTSDILKFHKERMLPELEDCVTSEECLMGEVFDRLAPKLIIYSDCLAGFSEAMRAISHKEKKNSNFHKCLHEIQSSPKCAQLTLQNHMLNLVQRIPKYILFMKQYLKYLPQDSPDFLGTKNGLQSLMNVAHCNNRSIKKNEKKSLNLREEKLELLCIVCGKDVTNKHIQCTHCQKFYCKSCFSDRQSSTLKLKFCMSCLVESRKSIYKLQTESLKVKDGKLLVKKSRDSWVEQWFVIDSSGKFYSISSAKNDFDKVDVIPLENAKLRVLQKHSNAFVLHLKDNKSRCFRAPNKEEFDGWIEGFRSVLSEKQFIMFPTHSLTDNTDRSTFESET